MRRIALSLLLLNGATVAAAQDTGSQAEEVRIRWGSTACEPGEPLVQRVRALLPPDTAIPEAFEARAEVAVDGEAYRLRVELPEDVQREFVSLSCHPLADAAALVIAVAIDPSALTAPRAAAPPSNEAALPADLAEQLGVPEPPDAPLSVQTDVPRSEEAAPWTVGVAASGALAIGVLPSPLPGPVVGAMLAYDAAVLRVGFGYLPSGTAAYDETRGATLELFAARLSLCARLVLAPFTGELCADGEAGVIHAAGYGLDRPRASDVPYGSIGPSVRARVALVGPLGLHLAAGASFMVDPPTFVIEGLGDVYTPEPVSFRALLGLDLAWDFGGTPRPSHAPSPADDEDPEIP